MKTLIKNGTIITSEGEYRADILVDGERIAAIGTGFTADQVVDASGRYIFAGGVDQHTHFNFQFGTAVVRGFETSAAALVGGTTTVVDFANQEIGRSIADSIQDYRNQKIDGVTSCDYALHGVVFTPDDPTIAEIPRLPEIGVSTLKLFMAYKGHPYHCDDEALFRALRASRDAGVTIMVHAENADVIDVLQQDLLTQGRTEPYSHALSRPPVVEHEATQRAILLAEAANAPLFVVHVTCKEAMEAVRSAYQRGLDIYGETCAHYLVLDRELLAKPNFEGAKYVCSPPLRTEEHRNVLWEAIDKNWLVCVSSDHCGFDYGQQKHLGVGDFTKIPNGTPSMENRLAILWTYGVEQGRISRSRMVDLFSTTPAKINGIFPQKGMLSVGSDADIVIFDPTYRGVITAQGSLQGVDYSPFEGMEQIGRAETVLLRGNIMVHNGTLVGETGKGKFIPGKPFGMSYQRRTANQKEE